MNEWRFRIIVIALSVWVAVGIVWNIVAYTRVERKPEITVASDYALLPASALSDYVSSRRSGRVRAPISTRWKTCCIRRGARDKQCV